jgi:hypothetical protein
MNAEHLSPKQTFRSPMTPSVSLGWTSSGQPASFLLCVRSKGVLRGRQRARGHHMGEQPFTYALIDLCRRCFYSYCQPDPKARIIMASDVSIFNPTRFIIPANDDDPAGSLKPYCTISPFLHSHPHFPFTISCHTHLLVHVTPEEKFGI